MTRHEFGEVVGRGCGCRRVGRSANVARAHFGWYQLGGLKPTLRFLTGSWFDGSPRTVVDWCRYCAPSPTGTLPRRSFQLAAVQVIGAGPAHQLDGADADQQVLVHLFAVEVVGHAGAV